MIILWTLVLTCNAVCHEVTESVEDTDPELYTNVTTLYPVVNSTKPTDTDENKNTMNKNTKLNIDSTVWKLETAFAEASSEESGDRNDTGSSVEEKSVDCKEFKPSLHLGNFFDDDSTETTPAPLTLESFAPVKKPSNFISSPKDDLKSILNKIPKEILRNQGRSPYKFDSSIFTRLEDDWKPVRDDNKAWQQTDVLETKPTVQIPVEVPAGGMYKHPDAFKGRPNINENFGMDLHGEMKNFSVKKRINPWRKLLHIVTAFIPVGLIISALTPSVITVQNTGQEIRQPALYRRSDSNMGDIPSVSERCRRRLLCELYSETNYEQNASPTQRRGRQCYRIRCEDPHVISKILHWLLSYHQPNANINGGGYFT